MVFEMKRFSCLLKAILDWLILLIISLLLRASLVILLLTQLYSLTYQTMLNNLSKRMRSLQIAEFFHLLCTLNLLHKLDFISRVLGLSIFFFYETLLNNQLHVCEPCKVTCSFSWFYYLSVLSYRCNFRDVFHVNTV